MTQVPPSGPRNARIALVGEAPGRTEEMEGRPFVGASGKLLGALLAKVGIARGECYLTNVMQIRPPRNKFEHFYDDGGKRNEPSAALLRGQDRLEKELLRVRPNITICLGDEPLRAVTGRRGITKWRGSLQDTKVGKALGTFHPSYILRQYEHRAILELDLKRGLSESTSPDLALPIHNFTIRPSVEDALSRLTWIEREKPTIAFDIETLGHHVRCLGLAWNGTDALCIPFISNRDSIELGGNTLLDPTDGPIGRSYWTEEDEREILRRLEKIMWDRNVPKIAQNFPFDSTLLARDLGIKTRGLWMDTMVAQHECYSELPKSLDFLASIYTRIPYYADYDASSDLSTWRYNCFDCVATWESAQKLEKEMRELGVERHYRTLSQRVMQGFTRMQNRGVLVDVSLRDEMKVRTQEELVAFRTSFADVGLKNFNPSSSKQVQELLYGKLHMPVQKDMKTGNPTTGEKALARLQVKYPQHAQVIVDILEYRQKVTLLGTFLSCELRSDGRMETSYNATGAKTGRVSSSKTIFGTGGNMQNITKSELRRIYIVPEGHTWVKADLSQAQVMIVAWEGDVRPLVEKFLHEDGFDIHRWNAANIFRVEEGDVSPPQRQHGKVGVHGGNFHMGAKTASLTYKVPYAQAKASLEAYWNKLPDLAIWWKRVQEQLHTERMLRSPLGRLRVFFGRMDEGTYRQAYAQIPQAVEADIANRAMYLSTHVLEPQGASVILQMHDELGFDVPTHKVRELAPVIKNLMEISIKFPLVEEPLKIPVDISAGPNWWDQKPLDTWTGDKA